MGWGGGARWREGGERARSPFLAARPPSWCAEIACAPPNSQPRNWQARQSGEIFLSARRVSLLAGRVFPMLTGQFYIIWLTLKGKKLDVVSTGRQPCGCGEGGGRGAKTEDTTKHLSCSSVLGKVLYKGNKTATFDIEPSPDFFLHHLKHSSWWASFSHKFLGLWPSRFAINCFHSVKYYMNIENLEKASVQLRVRSVFWILGTAVFSIFLSQSLNPLVPYVKNL